MYVTYIIVLLLLTDLTNIKASIELVHVMTSANSCTLFARMNLNNSLTMHKHMYCLLHHELQHHHVTAQSKKYEHARVPTTSSYGLHMIM